MTEGLHDGRRFEGMVAVVSGGGSSGEGIGNGRAAAVLLARGGASVMVIDRDPAAAEATAQMVRETGAEAATAIGDVTDSPFVRGAMDEAAAAFGGIDVLVNNVGVTGPPATVADIDLEAWDRMFAVNVTSCVLASRHALPHIVGRGGGAIVNISSIAGLLGSGGASVAYGASKGAVVALTRTMAAQHGRDGVRVNCVVPGMVHTPMVAASLSQQSRQHRAQQSLLQVEGTGWDVGHAVAFLASREARWITGVVLPVDGGLTAGSTTRGVEG